MCAMSKNHTTPAGEPPVDCPRGESRRGAAQVLLRKGMLGGMMMTD
jgi:hypothetical protein